MINIHVGANNISLLQSEVNKGNTAEMCKLVNAMSDAIVFSGSISMRNNDQLTASYGHCWILDVQMVLQKQCGI